VSTDKQAEHGISLEAQAEKIRAMALVQGAELSEIIVESGESAKSLNRPSMARLAARQRRAQLRRRSCGASLLTPNLGREFLDDMPNELLCHSITPGLVGAAHLSKELSCLNVCCRSPVAQ